MMPKGTRIDVSFWYDNSAARAERQVFNPNRPVWSGDRTNDEMQLAFVGLAEIEPEAGASNQRD